MGGIRQAKVQVWIWRERAGELEVLLLRVLPSRGGFWQPVTGHVEAGESIADAARREASEETGLEFANAPGPIGFEFEFEHGEREIRETVFAAKAVSETVRLDSREHVESRWAAPEEALEIVRYESNRKALRHWLARGTEARSA